MVLAVPVHERARRRALLGDEHGADEERVVADVVLRDGPRLDPAERAFDQRRDLSLRGSRRPASATIGGRPEANCRAIASCPAPSMLIAKPPAWRSSS